MESLKLVSDLDDRKKAHVSLISDTMDQQPYYASPVESSSLDGVPAAGASLREARIESSRRQRASQVSVSD